MKPLRCPCCRLRTDGMHLWIFRTCAACGARFRIRRRFLATIYALAFVVSFGIAFAMGSRGHALSSLVCLLVAPTFWAMLMINLRIFPPDIEVVREGWTPGQSDKDRELEEAFELLRELDPVVGREELPTAVSVVEESTDIGSGRLPLSTPKDPPVTLEGIVIAVAVTLLLAYHVYVALGPFIDVGRSST